MTRNILKIFKTIFIIIFYFLYSSIGIYLLKLCGINIEKLNLNYIVLIFMSLDILFMLFLYIVYHKDINDNIKDFKQNFKKYFTFGLKLWLIGIVLMYVSNIILSIYIPSGSTNENLIQSTIEKLPFYMFFSSVIVAPFVEEIVFRKSIREIFTNDFIYIIVCALLFGGIHIISSNTYLEMLYFIPYSIFGFVFGYIYIKTNNIFTSMIFHFIHNFILVTISIIFLYIGV